MPNLRTSLQSASGILTEASRKFAGLSPHASLLKDVCGYLASDAVEQSQDIHFLERTELYSLCAAALQSVDVTSYPDALACAGLSMFGS